MWMGVQLRFVRLYQDIGFLLHIFHSLLSFLIEFIHMLKTVNIDFLIYIPSFPLKLFDLGENMLLFLTLQILVVLNPLRDGMAQLVIYLVIKLILLLLILLHLCLNAELHVQRRERGPLGPRRLLHKNASCA